MIWRGELMNRHPSDNLLNLREVFASKQFTYAMCKDSLMMERLKREESGSTEEEWVRLMEKEVKTSRYFLCTLDTISYYMECCFYYLSQRVAFLYEGKKGL